MAVHLTKIYTRTGDDGTTALGDFTRTSKNDPRLVAYADTDETGAALGLALTTGEADERMSAVIRRLQNELFDVGADLCVPLAQAYEHEPLRITPDYISRAEENIDAFNADLESLKSFILAGGTALAAGLHMARTIARRAERSAWLAIDTHGTQSGGVNPLTAKYLNRLSDLLFVLARAANKDHGDVLWVPGGERA